MLARRSSSVCRLFFKLIKQHLRIKAFYGTSVNAVRTQTWIAISVYALVAILKKRLGIDHSLYTLLQLLSARCSTRKSRFSQALANVGYTPTIDIEHNQLLLFDL